MAIGMHIPALKKRLEEIDEKLLGVMNQRADV